MAVREVKTLAISNDQLTWDRNTCSKPISSVPSSLAVQCPRVRERFRHSTGDRCKDCLTWFFHPLHPQRPVCLASKYIISFFLLPQTQKPFKKNVHWTSPGLSFNLRNVINTVYIWEIEIRERAMDWKDMEAREESSKKKKPCYTKD